MQAGARQRDGGGALANLVVIGGMKCGTSALHRYLAAHPEIAMSAPKELCFFYDPPESALEVDGWTPGNWFRGLDWYRSHFPTEQAVRGESSPGYTSPAHPEVAERMAAVIPEARLLLLVRDPVQRAISQYRHHRADGAELRQPAEALLDEGSQYLSRGRYHERLRPFLAHFPLEQLLVVSSEELLADRRAALRRIFAFAGVDPDFWTEALAQRHHTAQVGEPDLDAALRSRLRAALHPDAEQLRVLLGRDLAGWEV